MRKLSKEQLKLWYFDAVRSVLILENGLLPDEADATLSAAGLKEDIENYTEVQLHVDPRDTARELRRFYPVA